MVFHPKSVFAAVWNLSGVKSGQEIGKTLSIAQNGARQASNCIFAVIYSGQMNK
jgi:hypothetical protein